MLLSNYSVEKLFNSNRFISIEQHQPYQTPMFLQKCNDIIKEINNIKNLKLQCFFFQTETIQQLINMQLQNDDRLTQKKVITKLQNLIIAQKDVEKVTLDDNLLINQCINYLINFNDDLSVDMFLKISISLLDERFDKFTLLNLVEFVRRFFLKEREDISQVLKIIDNFIIYSWNVFAYGKYEKQNGNQFFLIQSIILELWIAAHFPIMKKNDAEKIEDFDTFLKDEFNTENDDDEIISQFGDKERFLSEIIDKWQLSDEMSNHQNLKFINNVKIWFNSNFLFSVYDPEPYNNELDLDTLFTNVSQEIMEIVNNYRLTNKFPMTKPLQNIVKSEEELFLDLITGG